VILIRAARRSFVQVPLGSLLAWVICSATLGSLLAYPGETGVLVSTLIFEAITLFLVISGLHSLERIDDQLIMRWALGTKSWSAEAQSLHAALRGSRSVSLQLELVGPSDDSENPFPPTTTIATLSPNERGWAKAEAIAKLMGVPLIGDRPSS